MSEYALIGEEQAKQGTLLGAVSEAGFLIGLERNRLINYSLIYINLYLLSVTHKEMKHRSS